MKIDLSACKYYFLTCENEKRRTHFWNEFAGLDITEVHPIVGIGRIPSGITGFSRMLDKAVCDQPVGQPFRPFVLMEDDVKKYREFPDSVVVPDDADFLYVGISSFGMNDFSHCHDVFYKGIDNDVVRVFNMLSLHGIMVCSLRGVLILQKCLMESRFTDLIWDIYTARMQPFVNAYALRVPLVYQFGELGGQEGPTKIEFSSPDRANIPPGWIHRQHFSFLTCHPDCSSSL